MLNGSRFEADASEGDRSGSDTFNARKMPAVQLETNIRKLLAVGHSPAPTPAFARVYGYCSRALGKKARLRASGCSLAQRSPTHH